MFAYGNLEIPSAQNLDLVPSNAKANPYFDRAVKTLPRRHQ
ncbi:hypothetical protein EYZ11_007402 [Aspergillus tanneri]|uniref:Uncharacterized protein n=1 Tax=Aspergillus tanneri TaxID=1220188 RepID=A0A4S3JDG2_9EURO|nr:hypothetical protein EYZ11_007402 [Aspergillus tanneri]